MSFDIKAALSDEDMRDIVTTGFESGSYGSLVIIEIACPPDLPAGWEEARPYKHTWAWAGGRLAVTDRYGDDEYGEITRESLQRGLQILGEKYPHLLAQLVSGNYHARREAAGAAERVQLRRLP
jgi:hypothetical protein